MSSMPDLSDLPPLRYLDAEAVRAAMPPLPERFRLAERTLTALARPGGAELPPKIGVHPRPEASFAHAMPAHLRHDAGVDGDLLGMKWIAGFGQNRDRGLPAIHGLIVLNDAATGIPTAILDAGPVTAERTAAVSGVAIARFAAPAGSPPRAALIGAGVQGHSHLEVLGHVLPGVELAVFDRHPDRAEELAARARAARGIAAARACAGAREAVHGADVVVTAASFGPVRQVMTNAWLAPTALVVAVDYAMYCAAEVARDAALFVVDERGQFLANRDAGQFDGYPDPAGTLGDAILGEWPRPPGRVVVTHLGVGLADVVFGDAILRTAAAHGLGIALPR